MPSASRLSPAALRSLLLAPCSLLLGLPAAAQTASDTIIDRATQAPSLPATPPSAPETAPAAPGADSDAGVQRIAEPRPLPFVFGASFDQQLYVASNVFLAPDAGANNDTGALVSATTLALGLDSLPRVVGEGRLLLSVGLVWQRNLHGLATSDQSIEDLDFDSWSLPLAASYRFGRGWEAVASFTIGSLYSIGDAPSHELLYRSHTPALSLRKLLRLSDGLIASLGGGISYSDTDASLHDVPAGLGYRQDRNDRLDASLSAALYAIDGPWTFSPALRLSQGHYLHWQEAGFSSQDRDDLLAGASLTIAYALGQHGAIRGFATYDLRESSGGVVDYDYAAGTAGFGLSLGLRY